MAVGMARWKDHAAFLGGKMLWNKAVRTMLREARIEAGINVMEMAHYVGRDHRTLRRIESGDVEPRSEIVDLWLATCKKKALIVLDPPIRSDR